MKVDYSKEFEKSLKKLSGKMLDSTHACNIYYFCYTNISLYFILISLL